MRTILALFLGIASAGHITYRACEPCAAPTCPPPAATQLDCPCVDGDGKGYGSISSRSKGQSQSAARADNQFEQENDQLSYSGNNQEAENSASTGSSYEISTQYISINGEYNAEQAITDSSAAKVGESGKAANCFRRESAQHLNEIAGQNLPEPLAGRDLVDCDCQDYSRPLKEYTKKCYC